MKTTEKIAVATAMFALAVLLGAMAVWMDPSLVLGPCSAHDVAGMVDYMSEYQFVQGHIFRATAISACWLGVILIVAIWVAIKKRLCTEEDPF